MLMDVWFKYHKIKIHNENKTVCILYGPSSNSAVTHSKQFHSVSLSRLLAEHGCRFVLTDRQTDQTMHLDCSRVPPDGCWCALQLILDEFTPPHITSTGE